jgi:ectoine hydroxylase-related dioxygenase (phytanoyl-CoA dioxygenase family)
LIFNGNDDQYDEKAFVPVEIKAGDAILIHGQVVHKSEQSMSNRHEIIIV